MWHYIELMGAWMQALPNIGDWSSEMLIVSNMLLWERYARLRTDLTEIKRALKIRSTVKRERDNG